MSQTDEINADPRVGAGLALRFDPALRAVIATVVPEREALPVDEGWLDARLIANGWGALRRVPAAIALLLGSFNRGAAVEALRIAEAVDGQFDITLDDDGLAARLTLQPPQGGAAVSSEAVRQTLADMGIGEGIDDAALVEAVLAEAAQAQVIARGRAPVHGADGYLETLTPSARTRAPRVSETGQIDYRDLGDIVVVHPGEALMRRHPPGEGVNGRTLTGLSLPARAGMAVMFGANLPGTQISADDPDLLCAAITGQPVEVRGGMMVEPVLVVEAVSMASGNLRFEGSVVIRGDVASGMSVQADGDIEVGGVVELATLEAGGSIAVRGGIIGAQAGRKESTAPVLVRAKLNVEAGYAQNARIEAGDCIVIDDTAVACELTAGNHILVGRKKRGCLIGGRHEATLSITAKEVGSPQRIATVFEIGINPAMHKHMLELAKTRDGRETQLLEVSKLLQLAQQQPGKLPVAVVDKARQTAAALAQSIAELREDYERINQQVALAMGARVVALQKLHEGVEVRLGERRYKVPSEFAACAVGLDRKGNLGLVAVDDSEDDPSV